MKIQLIDRNNVRMLIAEKGKSLRGFSKDIEVSQAYLSQILNEKRNPSPMIAHKIAKGLGLEIKDIFLTKVID